MRRGNAKKKNTEREQEGPVAYTHTHTYTHKHGTPREGRKGQPCIHQPEFNAKKLMTCKRENMYTRDQA